MARRSLWILNHYAAPSDRAAGTRHYDLGRALTARGYDVTVFAAGFSHFTLKEERLKRWQLFATESFSGVRFVWIRTVPYRRSGLVRLINMLSYAVAVMAVQVRFSPPRWVIGSSVHPFAALAGYFIARARGATFLYEVRDLWPQTLIDMGAMREQSLAAKGMRLLERVLLERCAAVITLLGDLPKYLRERGIHARRVEYIPNGVQVTDTTPDDSPLPPRVRAWLEEGRFVCGYVGTHGVANRLEVVVQAARLLQDRSEDRIGIVFVGDGPEKPRLKRLVEQLRLRNVVLLDPIPKSQVPSFIARLHAGIFHLAHNAVFRYGISSNKLFDYLANGTPVIFACRAGYNPVQTAAAGISIPPDDPEALAKAMVSLATKPSGALKAMGTRGRRYVKEHHAIETLGTKLDVLLRQATT